MSDRKQINLLVDESQKDRWDAYVENSAEVSSLSHLIRLSVEREIDRERSPTEGRANDIDLSPVDDRFDELQRQVEEVSRSVDRIADREGQKEIEELAGDVYEALPRIEDEDEWRDRLEARDTEALLTDENTTEEDVRVDFPDHEEFEAVWEWYITIETLAANLGVSEYRARLAVEQVEESFARVKTHEHEGEIYVYVVV